MNETCRPYPHDWCSVESSDKQPPTGKSKLAVRLQFYDSFVDFSMQVNVSLLYIQSVQILPKKGFVALGIEQVYVVCVSLTIFELYRMESHIFAWFYGKDG